MKQLKSLTALLLIFLAFSTFCGTIFFVQACESGLKLGFSAGTSQVLLAGAVSNQITVQLQDASNHFVYAYSNIVVNLATASSSGHFFSDKNGLNQISVITIKRGQSSGSFFYQDTNVGNPTLTASSQSLSPATTQFAIKSADPFPSPSPSPISSPSPSPSPPISSPSPSTSPSPDPLPSPINSPSPSSDPFPMPTSSPSPPSSSPLPSLLRLQVQLSPLKLRLHHLQTRQQQPQQQLLHLIKINPQ